MIIKLTLLTGADLWINPNDIIEVQQTPTATYIDCRRGRWVGDYHVRETPHMLQQLIRLEHLMCGKGRPDVSDQ